MKKENLGRFLEEAGVCGVPLRAPRGDAGFLWASDRTQTGSWVSISRCLTQTSTKNCFKEVHVSGYLNESSLLDIKMLHTYSA